MSTDTKASEIFSEPCKASITQKLGQSNRKIYEEIIVQLQNVLKTLVEQAAQLEAKHKKQIKELESRLADKDCEILILSQSKKSLLMSLQKFQKCDDATKKTESRIEGVYECESVELSEQSKKSAPFNKNNQAPTLTEFNHDSRNNLVNQESQFSKGFMMSRASSNVKDSIAYDFQSQAQSNYSFAVKIPIVPVYFGNKAIQQNQKKSQQRLNEKLNLSIRSGKQHQQIGKDIAESKQFSSRDKLFILNKLSKQILSKMKRQLSKDQNKQPQIRQNQDFYKNDPYTQIQIQGCRQKDFFSKSNASSDTPNFAKTFSGEPKNLVRNFSDERFHKIQSNLNLLNQSSGKSKKFDFDLNQIPSFQKKSTENFFFTCGVPLNKTADEAFKMSQPLDIEFQINGEENANSSRKKKINLKNSSSKKVNVVNGKYVLKSPIMIQSKDLFNVKGKRNESDKKNIQKSGSGSCGNYSARKSQKKSNIQKTYEKVKACKQNNRNVVNSKQKVFQNHEYYIINQRKKDNLSKNNGSMGKHFRTESNQALSNNQIQPNCGFNQQFKKNQICLASKKMIRLQREKASTSKSPRKNSKKGASKQKYFYQMNYKFKVPKMANLSEVTSNSYLKQADSSIKLLKNSKRSKKDKSQRQKGVLQMSQSQGSLQNIKKWRQQCLQNELLYGRSSLPIIKNFYNKQSGNSLGCKEQIRQNSCQKQSQQSIQKIAQLNYTVKNCNYSQANNNRQSFPINTVKSMTNIVPVRQISMKTTFE